MLEYFTLDARSSNLPVYPILVISGSDVTLRSSPPLVMDFPNKRVLQFDFDVVDLPRMRAASYVRITNPAALALSARMDFRDRDRLAVITDFMVTLLRTKLTEPVRRLVLEFFFAYQRLTSQEALQMEQEIAKVESSEMRERIMQLTNPWIEAGKEQGLQQGRREGEADLVLRLLNRRFGLSESEQRDVRSLPLEKIEALGEALLDFYSREDLASWLRSNA